jgi:hypothetical protein
MAAVHTGRELTRSGSGIDHCSLPTKVSALILHGIKKAEKCTEDQNLNQSKTAGQSLLQLTDETPSCSL